MEDPVLSLSSNAPAAPNAAAMTAATVQHSTERSGDDNVLDLVLATLDEEKASDVVSISLRGKSEMADHMVIASGRSTRQVISLSEKLVDKLKRNLRQGARIEGKSTGDWVLIDAGDVITHIFRPEVREFYQLEKMWINLENETFAQAEW